MYDRRATFSLLAVVSAVPAAAQAPSVAPTASPVAEASPSPFRPLALPTPSLIRTGSGRPGSHYWQQRADYRIQATLDTGNHTLTGRETIHYVNRSPDALPYLWLFVEQNICGPTSITEKLDQPPLVFLGSVFDFSCKGFAGGLELTSVVVGLTKVTPVGLRHHDAPRSSTRARRRAPRSTSASDGGSRCPTTARGGWAVTGRSTCWDSGIREWRCTTTCAGWNHDPYIGGGEFYLEYGSFDVSISVPATYIVGATGTLVESRTGAHRRAACQAREGADRPKEPVAIISADEAGHAVRTRPATSGRLTWRFTADSVRDFAFGAAPDFRWDASGYKGKLVHTLYRPSAPEWEEANRMVREGLSTTASSGIPIRIRR